MFEPNAHVGEDAELYALGDLDDVTRERVERHVRTCAQCGRRVGDAESAVLRLIEAQPAVPTVLRPFSVKSGAFPWRWALAIAAAFVLGLLPWLAATVRTTAPPATEQLAMSAMLDSHFQHAQFVADTPGAPSAKVIFGRTGGWLYVLVSPGDAPLSVVTVGESSKTTVATLPPGRQTRAVFVTLSARIDEVRLLDGTRQVAHAKVAFAEPR